jgi:hypothetical protein
MQKGYYKAAWNDIKNSPNWFGKLCLLALVWLIPVFGAIVANGYLYGWAREIAWNLNKPLPAHLFGNEDGKLYRRGWFVLVIGIVMAIVPCLLYVAAQAANGWQTGDWNVGAGILMALYVLAGIAFTMASWVGSMRMTLYDNLGAGLQFKQIFKMMAHDFTGLVRIFVIQLVISIIIGLVVGILLAVVLFGAFVAMMGLGMGAAADFGAESLLGAVGLITAVGPVALLLGYAGLVGCLFVQTVVVRAVGYWTRDFQVDRWGNKKAPLPFEVGPQTATPPTNPAQ